MTKNNDTARELLVSRVFNAPRTLVFKVWTDPKHVVNWWGPTGFTNTIHEMDVKSGGTWRFTMHGPDGVDYPNKIIYKEVTAPERLVFSYGNDDATFSERFEVTVTFEEKGKKTEISIRMVFASKEERDKNVEQYGAIEGNRQTFDRLEAYLAKL